MDGAARREEAGFTPRRIYERLDRYVIGQDAAKRAVAIAAYNHLKRVQARRVRGGSLVRKSNILLVGPTGSGKTHIARNLAEILSVPFAVVDATEYTEAGYYGKDVELMISDLLLKANHCVEDAQQGIVFIDEVDKLARRWQGARNGAGARDIGGEGVQQALLKLLEGREVTVPLSAAQTWNKHDSVQVDTQDILFICAGTFSDLFDGKAAEEGGRSIGFGAGERARTDKRVTIKELAEFGMLSEFLGRVPVVVQLAALTEEELLRVLTEPPDALTREFEELLGLDDIRLEFQEPALREIVRYSMGRGLGARGLRAVLEHVMAEVMFEAPERTRRAVEIGADFVRERLAGAQLAL